MHKVKEKLNKKYSKIIITPGSIIDIILDAIQFLKEKERLDTIQQIDLNEYKIEDG